MSSTQQQQQIIVKAYYNDLNERQPEIRRFILDISSDKDIYQTLETTISQFNVDYPQGQFTLQYMDEDNDRITFSSNSELQSALKNNSTSGIIKIFVKPKSKNNEQSNQNPTVHIGVICDGCQGSIVGNRYKCLECLDYDLCQICSEKNLHSEHNMLKLTRPFHHRRCGNGSRFPHHFMRRKCRPFARHFPWIMNNFLSQFKGKELSELIEAHIPEHLRTEKLNEILNQFKTNERADKSIDETFLLENVGKVLQEILSSFGINCDYSGDKQNQESKPTEKKEEEASSATASNNTSTESKPTVPPLSNLIEQLQTMFAPMFQPPTTALFDDQKKIDECIERMTSMGFVDSNGVLTELIKSKKGDLEQVLDALNPRNYKN